MARQKWLLLSLILVSVLLVGAVVWAMLATPTATDLHWTMTAAVVDETGEVGEKITVTLKGKIKNYRDSADLLDLKIDLPESSPYYNFHGSDGLPIIWEDGYIVCCGFVYNRQSNSPAFCTFALDLEKEQLIVNWDGTSNGYLVAAKGTVLDASAVLKNFQAFTDTYIND